MSAERRNMLAGKGNAPSSGSPLLLTTGDHRYAFACAPGGTAGPGAAGFRDFRVTALDD